MVSADRGCENVWSRSNNKGVSEKLLKWQAYVRGELTKCATFKIQAAEAANLWVFVGMVKGDAELKIFHSMLKHNGFFVAQNISGNAIAFMGDRTLEGRPWIFKIPRDKPWAWQEIKFLSNPIEMKKNFSQEENCHSMWDTTGRKDLTTVTFPRLAVAPYAVVEWMSKRGLKPNEFRVWLEEKTRKDVNCSKEDWELFSVFSMAAENMDPNDKKISVLDMNVEPVTVIDKLFWKWADQILDATFRTRPTRYLVTDIGGTSQIDQSLWENLTRVMVSSMGEMIHAPQIQQQPTSTPSAQAGHREFYSN